MSARDLGSFGVERREEVLVVRGDVDESMAPAFVAALADPAVEVVDMAAVTFLDSGGLRRLVGARSEREAAGAPFVLRSPSRAVRRLLELTGLEAVFTVEDAGGDQARRGDPVS